MKKNIKIFLIILAILLITYLSITIYKFSVIHNIIINDSKNYNSNNFYYSYSYRWPDSDKDLQKVSDVYYKNGHSKNIVYLGKEKQIKYYGDKENNKTYCFDENNEYKEIDTFLYGSFPTINSYFTAYSLYPIENVKDQIKFALSLKTWIHSIKYNDKACYKITCPYYQDNSKLDVFIEKENYTLLEGHTNLDNTADTIWEYKFDVIKDSDVVVPEINNSDATV